LTGTQLPKIDRSAVYQPEQLTEISGCWTEPSRFHFFLSVTSFATDDPHENQLKVDEQWICETARSGGEMVISIRERDGYWTK
jgi:hypothetical protein